MSRKLKIGLDLDNVTCDFQRGWIHHYTRWFALDGKSAGINADLWHAMTDETHFGDIDDFWAWARAVPGFWQYMQPEPGALGGVFDLLRAGHHLTIVTNRPEWSRADTKSWLHANWPVGYAFPEVQHVEGDKSVTPHQLFIEDNLKRIEELETNQRQTIRFEQPWNVECLAGIPAKNWRRVVEIVEAISNDEPVFNDDGPIEHGIVDAPLPEGDWLVDEREHNEGGVIG